MKHHRSTAGTELKKSLCYGFFQQVYRHPFICAGLVCFFCLLLTPAQYDAANTRIVAAALLLLGGGAAVCAGKAAPEGQRLQRGLAITLAAAAGAVIFIMAADSRSCYSLLLMNGGLAVCGGVFLYLLGCGRLNTKSVIMLLIAAGFIMRLSYIVMMSAKIVQHDVYYLGAGDGHSGYIEYLYHNKHLPDMNVTEVDQFYHPPLHHILAALWMRFQTTIGISYPEAYENIQLLTLFYSTVCLILCYKIFYRIGLRSVGLCTATAVMAFCPIFYVMSGSLNNDILSIAFILGAILNTLYWLDKNTVLRIIPIALCVGLGMMTKLSVWMVAPAIAFVFIYAFFKHIKKFVSYLAQFAVFLIICVPLALFWPLRSYLRWQIPFTYVQRFSEKSHQYIGDIPISKRLFDFSPYMFNNVATQYVNTEEHYNEYNPMVGFFKSSLFDEGIAVRRWPRIDSSAHVLFWIAVALGLLGFFAMLYLIFERGSRLKLPVRVFVGLIYSVFFVMYYIFCIKFPHVCTMNVRYGIPLIVVGALSLGYVTGELFRSKKLLPKLLGGGVCLTVAGYAVSGYLVYSIVAESLLKQYA